MLKIQTFGGFLLWKDGVVIQDMGSRKAEAILVYTLVAGRSQNRNVLSAMLWPESSEVHALTSLRVALTALHRELNEYVDITRETVGIRPGAQIDLDVSDLDERLRTEQVEQALEIYHGDFLAGFHLRDSLEFEDWRSWQAERLRRLVINGLQSAITNELEAQDYKRGLYLIQRLLELDPLDEWAHRQGMLLYALDGQRGRALEQYETCRVILQAELGVKPSQETQQLQTQISQRASPLTIGFTAPPHNLPVPQTSFIGREKELVQIAALLRDPACRLLTLVGPGGIGKTRLALRVATKVLRSFPDGVYFIPLETLSSPDYLVPAIASALQFHLDIYIFSELAPKYQLFNYLRNRSILLILDGSEHFVANGDLLSEILANAPRVKILVTSRQTFEMKGEWKFPVTGLPIPEPTLGTSIEEIGALRLFNERARQASINFQPSVVGQESAVQICRLLEGIPLGIELAAAWTPLLSPQEIAVEIQKNYDFLTTSTRDIPEKHHSLRAVFDSTWLLLDSDQRQALCRLAVFRGDFNRQAAKQVAGVELSQLSSLVNKSLLASDSAGRFHFHALLQRYAIEKLREDESALINLSENHCRYYIDFLFHRAEDLTTGRMYIACDEIIPEIDNLRAAVYWAALHWSTEQTRKVLSVLVDLFAVYGWHVGIDVLRDIAQVRIDSLISSQVPEPQLDPVYLCARTHQAFYQCILGQTNESEEISRECLQPLQELGLRNELSECLQNLGVNASFRGEYERAIELLESAVLLGKEGQVSIWPTYLLWLGHTYWLQGDYQRGMDWLQKCFDIFEQRENSWGMAFALTKMGLVADGLELYEQAMTYHQKALKIFERINVLAGKAYVLSRMCMAAYFLDDYDQAVQYGLQGYHIFQSLGHIWGIVTSLSRLGFACLGAGELENAKQYFNSALVQSNQNQLIPQVLYALAGLACVLAQEGQDMKAVELFRCVKQHPQTPALYVQQAARWISHLDPATSQRNKELGEDNLVLEEVIEKFGLLR